MQVLILFNVSFKCIYFECETIINMPQKRTRRYLNTRYSHKQVLPPTLEHSCAFEGIFKNFLIFYTKTKKPRETNVNSTSVVSFDCEDLFSLRCSYVL